MRNTAWRQGFRYWLDGMFTPPDLTTEAGRHYTWQLNDDSLRGFILNTISRSECKVIKHLQMSNTVWEVLRERHEKRGAWHQLMLVKQLLKMRFAVGTPLNETIDKIDNLITRVLNMGDLDWPTFKTYVLINALGGEFEYMQSQIHASSNNPGFSTKTVVACILQESDLIKRHMEGGKGPSALISHAGRRERSPLICAHCKCTGYIADFCISCGGKFAGHTFEEACIAQRTALANNRTQSHTGASSTNNKTQSQNGPSSANIATNETNEASRPPSPAPSTTASATSSSTFMINGITYGPIPLTDSTNLAMVLIVDPNFPFIAYHAEEGPPSHISIDWNEFSRPVNVNCDDDILYAYSTSQLSGQQCHDSPFVLDSRASCHISPKRSDFTMLNPIAPHPITGLGGSCVYATGVTVRSLCLSVVLVLEFSGRGISQIGSRPDVSIRKVS